MKQHESVWWDCVLLFRDEKTDQYVAMTKTFQAEFEAVKCQATARDVGAVEALVFKRTRVVECWRT